LSFDIWDLVIGVLMDYFCYGDLATPMVTVFMTETLIHQCFA